MASKITRRGLLVASGAALGYGGARYFGSQSPNSMGMTYFSEQAPELFLNDASLLSPTPVQKHFSLGEQNAQDIQARVRAELISAQNEGSSLNVGAARHSMGGHAIPRDGVAIDLKSNVIEVDTESSIYRVDGGARWSDVIAKLDPLGFGPKVMQSNNDFGVAATFCVNAHGWATPFGPMGHSVQAIEMILPSGEFLRCSSHQNADVFNHAMGGYGLTGVITALEVEMVKNQNIAPEFTEMKSVDFGEQFIKVIAQVDVPMAYGRLNIDREHFFEDALMITYSPTEEQEEIAPASGSGWLSKMSRHLFRGQLGRENIKDLRWGIETGIGARLGAGAVNRNTLLNEPVITLDDRDPLRTDILHEYFVAPDRFADFIAICQKIIPSSYQELLNVTLRFVAKDDRSMLSYAKTDRIAAVMLFSQEMTARGEADMRRMTEELIDGVLDIEGSYYLPYRPHARQDQLVNCYPRIEEFVKMKRELDPKLILRNGFWDNYLETL